MPRGETAKISQEDLEKNPEAGRTRSQRLREPRFVTRGTDEEVAEAFEAAEKLVDQLVSEEGQSFFNWRKAERYGIEYTLGVERDREVPPASLISDMDYNQAVNLFEAMGAVMKDRFNKGYIEHYHVELNAFDEKGRKHTVTRHKDDRRKMRL